MASTPELAHAHSSDHSRERAGRLGALSPLRIGVPDRIISLVILWRPVYQASPIS